MASPVLGNSVGRMKAFTLIQLRVVIAIITVLIALRLGAGLFNCADPLHVTTTFRSDQTGGGRFLLGDGPVWMISQSISPVIYNALATRSGGEVFGEF